MQVVRNWLELEVTELWPPFFYYKLVTFFSGLTDMDHLILAGNERELSFDLNQAF